MIRDTLAIPATGAGVERQFSLSGRVATANRSRPSADTISKIMMNKDHLRRLKRKVKFWEGAGICAGEEVEKRPRTKFLKNGRTNGGISGVGCLFFHSS